MYSDVHCSTDINDSNIFSDSPLRVIIVKTKINIEQLCDPAVPLLGIYPEKTLIQKDTCTPMFIAALFTLDKTWKQLKCSLIKNI